jgi:hypothetical protein
MDVGVRRNGESQIETGFSEFAAEADFVFCRVAGVSIIGLNALPNHPFTHPLNKRELWA